LIGPLLPSLFSFLLGEAKDSLFFILLWRTNSACFYLDLECCFSFDLLSTELFFVRVVKAPLGFFLW